MLDKNYQAKEVEDKTYRMWEEGGYFTPLIPGGQAAKKPPFTIILPLPNANDPLHMGHALFTVEDIMVRYHRMRGQPTLWLPGADHAGIETQFVFEKYLAKKDQSRFDFDRKTLYGMIWDYVEKNREINKSQLKKLGFSLDWTRYHYSLEPEIIKRVLQTFQKLHEDGLIYRGERIVNFCTKCGTAFSELEVNYQERDDFLYFLDYGTITVATTRPETIFADVAVAVNPKDKKYKKHSSSAVIPLTNITIPIVEDEMVQVDFGTGALKITPGYDPVDFEIGQKNNLQIIPIMKRNGRLDFSHERFQGLDEKEKEIIKELDGLKVNKSREITVALLEKYGKLVKKISYIHSVGTCYRCGTIIEPLVIPQWFIKTKLLAKKAIDAVKNGETKIVPKKRFEKLYFDWLLNIKDWNISRQIVWGPQIPVWYCLDCNPKTEIGFISKTGEKKYDLYQNLKDKYSFDEIINGIQYLIAGEKTTYQLKSDACTKCRSKNLLQETDTFDTWFLSGQWPVNTLKSSKVNPPAGGQKSKVSDFDYFYPTSVLDTLWDILPFWVSRMMMLGIYLTGKAPFKTVHLHSRVVDKQGQKMSKSKGNVIDPLIISEKYGADSLRLALILGIAPASDISLSEEKIIGMRNFCNKLWNIARFILIKLEGENIKKYSDLPSYSKTIKGLNKDDRDIIRKLHTLIKEGTRDLENYRFGQASEKIYQFTWHEFADKYLELVKERQIRGDRMPLTVLRYVLINILKLLHPFIPFVTERIWQEIPKENDLPLIVSSWPKPVTAN